MYENEFNFSGDGEMHPEMCSFEMIGDFENLKQLHDEGRKLLWSFNPNNWKVKLWYRLTPREDHRFIDREADNAGTKGYFQYGRVELSPEAKLKSFAPELEEMIEQVIAKNFKYKE